MSKALSSQRLFACLLVALCAMVAAAVSMPLWAWAEDEPTNHVTNGGFEQDFWTWGNENYWNVYPTDGQWGDDGIALQNGSDHIEGSNSLNFYSKNGHTATVKKESISLPAGEYRVTAQYMGADASVAMSVWNQTANENAVNNSAVSLTGWGTWLTDEGTFTLAEDSVCDLSFWIEAQAGGYGNLDDVRICLASTDPDPDPDPNPGEDPGPSVDPTPVPGSLQNGSFEVNYWDEGGAWTVDAENWTGTNINQPSGHASDGEKALSYFAENAQTITVSQNTSLKPGAYQMSAYFNGPNPLAGDSSTATMFTTADEGTTKVEYESWDAGYIKWNLVFNVTAPKGAEQDAETGVTVGFKFDCKNGGWGYVDNVTLSPYTGATEFDIKPIEGLRSDFIKGADMSGVLALEKAGVVYKDQNGHPKDVFKILADAGFNYVRLRVWNDPYDAEGNGYGGGNCDVKTAATLGKRAADAGLKTLLCFHYSDFWAHPGNQAAPKAWAGYTVDQKAEAISSFTTDALTQIKDAGADIGMVQVGNETVPGGRNFGMMTCGERDNDSVCKLLKAGAQAVRAFDSDIKIMLHPTHIQYADNMAKFAQAAKEAEIDYDIFGVSYYTFWHGSLDTMVTEMSKVVSVCDKPIVIAETSYPYTTMDTDGQNNRISEMKGWMKQPMSVEGQILNTRDIVEAMTKIKNGKGLGLFYWGGEMVTVGNLAGLTWTEEDTSPWKVQKAKNEELWNQFGAGWASKYAGGYSKDALEYWGGTDFDNQALFNGNGRALESINMFKYLGEGEPAKDPYEQTIDPSDLVNMDIHPATPTIDIAKAKLTTATAAYTGTYVKPAVKVSLNGKTLVKGSDYTIAYSKAKKIGSKVKITISGMGAYSGKLTKTLTIKPKSTSIKSIAPARKAATVKWKISKKANASGYQIRYSLKSTMAKAKKSSKIKGYKHASKKVKQLKAGKKYYMQVRVYKVVSGKTYYSKWSKKKAVRVK